MQPCRLVMQMLVQKSHFTSIIKLKLITRMSTRSVVTTLPFGECTLFVPEFPEVVKRIRDAHDKVTGGVILPYLLCITM